jgi:Predicted phosphohydrolases
LDHRPVEQDEASKAGVDLLLNGHSHDGQMFPTNILLSLILDNSYGLKYFNGMANIVTSGIGLFGPNMRVGTNAEIVNIHLTFDK